MMRLPIATYRLQFNPSFGFRDAIKIVPYLAKLGISDIYASPIFRARKGSLHGYDIVDQNLLNPDLGGPEEFEALIDEVKSYQMGWIQDTVPNHMAYSHENAVLSDVLEMGVGSRHFHFFDIDWNHPWEGLQGKLLAPFLGDLYGKTLEQGRLELIYGEAGFSIGYYGIRLPLRLKSYPKILSMGLEGLERLLGDRSPDLAELKEVIIDFNVNPDQEPKRRLWDIYSRSIDVKRFIDANIDALNGKGDDPESFNSLDDFFSEQLFRLSFWKVASDDINYRRFFIVNDLICLRTERDEVFDHIHLFIFDLVEKGAVTGLRIDHIDGLHDPANYLRRVRERAKDGYIVAEKILLPGEHLPEGWPLQGTTGYDFLNCINGVLCDRGKKDEFGGIYARFTGMSRPYDDVVYEKKRLIADRHMSGEVDNLALLFKRSIGKDRHGRDITFQGIKKALTELLVLFPVYRTYVDRVVFSETDRAEIGEAARMAKERNMDLFNEIDFVEHYLLEAGGEGWLDFIMRFQQFTGPLMAKGSEDTALYVYCRLLSLSEVGADPGSFGTSLDEFHEFNRVRSEEWPHSMNATSTHDTKRGEDARARINVLSEMPEEWERHIELWAGLNAGLKKKAEGRDMPDRNDEYILYQALVGSYPFGFETDFRERARSYLIKAVREAKVHSGWVRPDTSYERASVAFLEGILDSKDFMRSFIPFQRLISHFGILNSIAQTIVKVTAPGIPDFYQGTELWDFSFVDPDNRRPVDFDGRMPHLRDIAKKEKSDIMGLISELLASGKDGRIKLFLIHRLLLARKSNADLFSKGEYIRLRVEGMHKDNVIAFARRHRGSWAMTIAPRLTTGLVKYGEMPLGREVWGDTCLVLGDNMPASCRDAITGLPFRADGQIHLGDVLEHFPAALLLGREE